MTTATLLRKIAILQDVQKHHHHTDREWLAASKILAELFAEMAKRT